MVGWEDGGVSRASLDKQPQQVAAMFDDVAERYDVTNDVLSLGLDRLWRRSVLKAVDPKRGERILDVAAGTGSSSVPLVFAGADTVPCDFSVGMLTVGKRSRPRLPFVAGDAMRLPFADESFDAVTITFGLRNVAVPVTGLVEMRRVTRPGGRLVVCEFSKPTVTAFRRLYDRYLSIAVPGLARKVSSDPESYIYLADSIQQWPDQEGLAALVAEAGWRSVQYRNLSGGIVALHRARR
jgi:demethylmenaquinone methyltransferase/2-methoxy-6-polyprenyl-1,4-benzoquinol methylase